MAPSGELNHLTGIALLLGIQTGLQRGDLPRTLEGVRPAAFLDGTAIRLMPTHGRVPANRAWAGRHPLGRRSPVVREVCLCEVHGLHGLQAALPCNRGIAVFIVLRPLCSSCIDVNNADGSVFLGRSRALSARVHSREAACRQ